MLEPIQPSARIAGALRAWRLLQDGNGAWQWAGLEPVAAMLGITDLAALIDDLDDIRGWAARKPDDNAQH